MLLSLNCLRSNWQGCLQTPCAISQSLKVLIAKPIKVSVPKEESNTSEASWGLFTWETEDRIEWGPTLHRGDAVIIPLMDAFSYPHLTEEEAEGQRDQKTCLRSP